MNDLIQSNAESYRASTDAAGMCRDLVLKTAKSIAGRKHIGVEGWMSIAIAHGCAASAMDVERVNDEGMSGFRATGLVRRMSDGQEIARAEGFVGDDEKTWAGRPVYARRAMVQTRAISRACRSAFAHVVVMIDAGLSTTPAEEVPHGGFDNGHVIEGTHTETEPTHTGMEGGKAEKAIPLEGVNKTRAKLKNAYDYFAQDMRRACDDDTLEALIASEHELVQQITVIDYDKVPVYKDGLPDGFLGYDRELAAARARIAEYGEQGDEDVRAGRALVDTLRAG